MSGIESFLNENCVSGFIELSTDTLDVGEGDGGGRLNSPLLALASHATLDDVWNIFTY
jgi:hypothetical protein